MPSIKDIIKIIEITPSDQAILLEGIHGIGKSQCIEDYFTKQKYRMVTLFLGQMADAGDLIGLPDREDSKETGYKHTIFCPPFWWPKSDEEKFILFLDELNRGKPEVMQCIMDMVLHRKLMGKDLPKGCKLIGAMNPLSDDGYYQVDELDPALLDRFNRYEFSPTPDEWLDWAYKEGIHRHVIGFITKNMDQLDPKTEIKSGAKANEIQPSRRSWERVSNIHKDNPDLEKNDEFLRTMLFGVIGNNATSRYARFIRDKRKGLTAGIIMTKWEKKVETELKKYDLPDLLDMNRQLAFWFQDNEKELKISKKFGSSTMKNLTKYINLIGNEPMAHFFNLLATDNFNKKTYPQVIMNLNPDIAEKYFDVLHGKEEEKVDESEYE
jgi:MoxR-like ATPase